MPRSRFGILRNERTRSTPLDTKLLFCCVLYHLGAFGTVKLPYESRGKTFRTSAKVHAMKSSRIFLATKAHNPPHWTLKSFFGAFRTVLVLLRLFGCVAKLGAKCSELVQKFMPRIESDFFYDERTRSTPLYSKLMFLVRFVPFGCIWDC